MSHWSSGVCPRLALVADGLAGGGVDAGEVAGVTSDLDAVAACESVSDQGRGTKWSVAGEAVLRVGAAGSGAPRKGDLGLPGAAEETGAKGGKTASLAWAGTAHPVSDARTFERGTTVLANRHYQTSRGTRPPR